jgi:predicted glycosyltransferase
MRVLIDINHPGHVHLFKNLYFELKKRNVFVLVTATHKDVATLLLQKYDIPFIDLGTYGKSKISKILQLPIKSLQLSYITWKHKIDCLFGVSFRVAHAGFLTKRKSFVFDDTEHAKQEILLYKYFATRILTPDCFERDLGKKHIKYNGYHELAYLHPDRFKPNLETLKELNLKENDVFFVLRFVSWEASHDIGQSGISIEIKQKLISMLEKRGRVLISSEGKLSHEFEKYRINICPTKMHDLLYYSSLFIGEGATMASECAVLGTPCIYVNSLDAGTLKNQVKYGLLDSLRTDENLISLVQIKLNNLTNEKKKCRANSKKMLNRKIDVTKFILELIP